MKLRDLLLRAFLKGKKSAENINIDDLGKIGVKDNGNWKEYFKFNRSTKAIEIYNDGIKIGEIIDGKTWQWGSLGNVSLFIDNTPMVGFTHFYVDDYGGGRLALMVPGWSGDNEIWSTRDLRIIFNNVTNPMLRYDRSAGIFKFDDKVSIDGEIQLGENLTGFQILMRIYRDSIEVGRIDNDGSDIRIRGMNGGDIKLADGGGTKVIVKSTTGKVGIGTTIPDEKLTIKNGSVIASEGFGTKLWDIDGGHFETAIVNVEYHSPNQHGGIYGPVIRTYFNTSLPSYLTSGNNVSDLIDYSIQFLSEGTDKRNVAHGYATSHTTSDKRCGIWLGGGSGNNNLEIDKESTGDDYEPIRGYVDYIKAVS